MLDMQQPLVKLCAAMSMVAGLAFACAGNALAQGVDSLDAGEPYYVRFVANEGTLQAGKVYLLFHDPVAENDHVSSIRDYGAIAAQPNSNANWDRGIVNAWGTWLTFQKIGAQACLVNAATTCVAHVLGRLSPAELPTLQAAVFDSSARVIASLSGSLQRLATGVGVAVCPSNSSVKLDYDTLRAMGDSLRQGAQLLPFLYRADRYEELRRVLEDAALAIRRSYPSGFTWTSYSDCFGGAEFQTATITAGGLYELYRLNGDPQIHSYILSQWYDAAPLFIALGHAINANGIYGQYINGFGQYLRFASIAQTLGADALQGEFTVNDLVWVFYAQSLTWERQSCGGYAYTETYGGWVHMLAHPWYQNRIGTDCFQQVGYHSLIVDGLIELHGFLRLARACPQPPGGYWTYACDNLPSNLLAATTWLYNIQNPDGFVPERAPGSGDPVTTDATYRATRTYYQLFAYLEAQGFTDATNVKWWYDDTPTVLLSAIKARALVAVQYLMAHDHGRVAADLLRYYRQRVTGDIDWWK